MIDNAVAQEKKGQTILCAWEIGAELGHISQLSIIAKALEREGHQVVVALKDLSRAYPYFCSSETGATLLQAPVWLPKISMQRPIACLADTLLLLGYLDTDPLHALVLAWQSIIELVQPDLVIVDYAPTALLALRRYNIPTISIGSGFADPVPGRPIADWRPYPTRDDLVARQAQRVLTQVNAVLAREQILPLANLSDLFAVNKSLITTFPELDVYAGQRQNASYCLAPSTQSITKMVQFGKAPSPRILAYLKPGYPHLEQLITALARCAGNVFIACPQGNPALFQPHVSDKFQFSTDLVNLPNAMSEADLFVGHGNATSVKESLIAGTPIVVLPIQLEQLLIGKKLQEQHLGVLIEQIKKPDDVVTIINRLLTEGDSYRAAIAALLAAHPTPRLSLAEAAVAACKALIKE